MSKNYVTSFRGESLYTPNDKFYVKDEPLSPDDEFGNQDLEDSFENDYSGMKKSLSMNDIAALRKDFSRLELGVNKQDVYNRYTTFETPISKTKFVSMAEAIYHFQRDTPGRFHSTKPSLFRPQTSTRRSELTVPQSPLLRSKARSRPHHILSQQEKEELELEELRKFKIKANPVPKSVIEGTKNLPEVPKKPVTVPEPFKLTEAPKKIYQSPKLESFKARPLPKHILDKPQIPVKLPTQTQKSHSPKCQYNRSSSCEILKCHKKTSNPLKAVHKFMEKPDHKAVKQMHRLGPVKPEPFSFEKRDEGLKKRREEKIKQQIEEERKMAHQFKAQPLPVAVKKQMLTASLKGSSSATSNDNKENNFVRFEAKPPSVLYKEPFKPVLQPLQLPKQVPFELTTEKRAAEREKFDKNLKLKEEEQQKLRIQREKEQQLAEEKAQAELRAKLVHHAKAVPVKSPFIPDKSAAPLTVPETPKFVRRLKEH